MPPLNGRLTNWILGILSAVLLAVGGAGISTWADTNRNTEKLKEVKSVPVDIANIQKDIEHLKEDNNEIKGQLKEILVEVRK